MKAAAARDPEPLATSATSAASVRGRRGRSGTGRGSGRGAPSWVVGRVVPPGPLPVRTIPVTAVVLRGSTVDDHDVVVASDLLGDPQRQVVRLAAGTHQEDDLERIGQEGGEAIGVVAHLLVDEARVGVQAPHLGVCGFDDPKVGVADMGDVVDRVEVNVAVGIDQLDVAPTDQIHR